MSRMMICRLSYWPIQFFGAPRSPGRAKALLTGARADFVEGVWRCEAVGIDPFASDVEVEQVVDKPIKFRRSGRHHTEPKRTPMRFPRGLLGVAMRRRGCEKEAWWRELACRFGAGLLAWCAAVSVPSRTMLRKQILIVWPWNTKCSRECATQALRGRSLWHNGSCLNQYIYHA
eukprot:TRINITY_DN99992_c0_g1_i1.p1 TRINITY_DN99992_c0_g1~~TRINITY_DN99992_c0_g1_i1.p1  ORF type:complete len:174 (-),score=15.32 TRINITY_DN99992_c0_g1_i1:57-578(-)